jgi:hypothetical protein
MGSIGAAGTTYHFLSYFLVEFMLLNVFFLCVVFRGLFLFFFFWVTVFSVHLRLKFSLPRRFASKCQHNFGGVYVAHLFSFLCCLYCVVCHRSVSCAQCWLCLYCVVCHRSVSCAQCWLCLYCVVCHRSVSCA